MTKIGLVLSGGGARGLTQIGVLKTLKKNNIKIDSISGCSIGALVGACYAYDENPQHIEQLLTKIVNKKWDIYDYTFSTKGLIKGEKLEQFITGYFSDSKKNKSSLEFKDLKIPLKINATDIVKGEEVVFDSGLLMPAIMASLSYPGFFTTRKINNRLCVDGGVVNPLPLNLLSDADYLILVDVSEEEKDINEDSNMRDVVLQATLIMQKIVAQNSIDSCTQRYIMIRPNVLHKGVFDFDHPEELIKLGEKETEKHLEQIRKDIESIDNKDVNGDLRVYRA